MTKFEELRVSLTNGLSMSVRRLKGGAATPVICIPGLTRNAADFEDLAPLIAASGRDFYAVTLRGRGASDYDPTYLNYVPATYAADILTTLDQLDIPRAIFIGTSLGGIVTMLTNERAPERVAAAIINDIDPDLAPEGIARIASYVAAQPANAAGAMSFDDAVARVRAINEVAFPGRDGEFWRTFARRTFEEVSSGSWRLAYDPNLGRALMEAGPAPDLWAPYRSMSATPTLVVRGAISDLLTMPIIDKMREARPGFDYCEVANVGHAPMLTEPEAQSAIARFIKKHA